MTTPAGRGMARLLEVLPSLASAVLILGGILRRNFAFPVRARGSTSMNAVGGITLVRQRATGCPLD